MLDSLNHVNSIGCRGNVKSEFSKKKTCFSRISRLKVTYMFMASTNSLVVLFFATYATADILTKLLQQCFLFFIVVVIPGHNLGNTQVSVNRTIGPTLVIFFRDLEYRFS